MSYLKKRSIASVHVRNTKVENDWCTFRQDDSEGVEEDWTDLAGGDQSAIYYEES